MKKAYSNVDITLIEDTTAGNPDRVYRNQSIRVFSETPVKETGVDGKVSIANFPSEIFWSGGSVALMNGVTDVRIEQGGVTIMSGSLNSHNFFPRMIDGELRFGILTE